MTDEVARQEVLLRRLIAALNARGARRIERIDTHISVVILADEFAYKFKKPLELGFLDYSTLELRRLACEEEVRLNKRYAPLLYLRAIPVTLRDDVPELGGPAEQAVEWGVKMYRFDANSLLANRRELLSRGLIERIAGTIAIFHRNAAVCPHDSPYGSAEMIYGAMAHNFARIRACHGADHALLDVLEGWMDHCFNALQPRIEARKAHGAVRECHGDLHLGNIAIIQGEPVLFDGIEFNPSLRWIDCFSDLAFLSMDLTQIGRVDLAHYLVNSYLQHSGDYEGLPLLRLYEVYRALVRAKVAAIRLSQSQLSARERAVVTGEFRRLLRTAEALSRAGPRALIITHGVAGSGKSTLSGSVLARVPAIRVRSDVERKRMACVDPVALRTTGRERRLYTPHMTERTYQRLAELAHEIIDAGFIALIDATFLSRARRQLFAAIAHEHGVPFIILSCQADTALLQKRVADRMARGEDPSDADLEVLDNQIARQEPLAAEELAHAIVLRPGEMLEMDDLVGHILSAAD